MEHKKIDILINNAGIVMAKFFRDLSMEEFEKVIRVNLLGGVNLIKHILPEMEKHKSGHIVNIASLVSLTPGIKTAEYIASKHALWGFHHSLRNELIFEKSPILTTLVCPYAVNTGMVSGKND
jgi:all-trans-retinol dehydrogenase (NAD+)